MIEVNKIFNDKQIETLNQQLEEKFKKTQQ